MGEVFNPAYQSGEILHSSALRGFLIGAAVGAIAAAYVASVVLSGGATLAVGCAVVGLGIAGTGLTAKLGGLIGSSIKSVKGVISTGSPDVFYGPARLKAARTETDSVECVDKGALGSVTFGLCGSPHGPNRIAMGAATVLINGFAAARKSDKTGCGSELDSKITNVFIGGPTYVSPFIKIESEIPGWLDGIATGMIVVGLVIAFEGPGIIVAFQSGFWAGMASLGWLGASTAASYGLGEFGGWLGAKTGNPYIELFGEFAGSLIGAGAVGGLRRAVQNGALNQASKRALIDSLLKGGTKIDPKSVIDIRKINGKIIWLETGSSKAGLKHILERHADDFARIGVPEKDIPKVLFEALESGKPVGFQGKGTGRPIYEIMVNGEKRYVAITVGSNGFIVGANPTSKP